MALERARSSRFKVSLTPMIDMVFLLVVFFMLTTTFTRNDGIQFHFGLSAEGEQAGDQTLLRLMVIGEDKVRFQGQSVGVVELQAALQEAVAADPDALVVIEPMEQATVQDVVHVVGAAERAGAAAVTLVE